MLNEVDKGPETFCVIFNGDISQYIIWSILYVIMYGVLQPVRQIVTQSLYKYLCSRLTLAILASRGPCLNECLPNENTYR